MSTVPSGSTPATGPILGPFSTVLVANRGEIAVRVIAAVQAAGLTAVAVYSDADATAPHVRAADVAVRIGPAPARESYLSIEALLAAARETGADAVHPGYGFLSERAAFAQACADAGLVFIGPSAAVMEVMGRKDRAREVAVHAGVPVVPSYPLPADLSLPHDVMASPGSDKSPAGLAGPKLSLAHAAGGSSGSDNVSGDLAYPLLVKAAAGGGGKGMRVVREPAGLDAAVAAARREAAAAFGDDTLLLERFVEHGRHVEVQVLADTHGSVLHLGERDCSVQRRHQKVLEEAPAPTITPQLRGRLLRAGVDLAAEVGYTGAGTVEFLVAGDEFFFLEMNTRLQVEHPVTEAVTGLDLVALQLRVAAGEALGLTQDEVTVTGHAIEARIYAEDPYAGFLPQAGRATVVGWPRRARVDQALESGQEVGTAYDPMLAKVVVHGSDREAARAALVRALDDTAVLGLTTNVGFCRDLAASSAYEAGEVHTAWLDTDPAAQALLTPPAPPGDVAPLAAWLLARHVSAAADSGHPFGSGDGWRSAGPAAPVLVRLADPVPGGAQPAGATVWHVDLTTGVSTPADAANDTAYHTADDPTEDRTEDRAEDGAELAAPAPAPVTSHQVQQLADPAGGHHHRLRVDGHLLDVTALVDGHGVELTRCGHRWRVGVPDPLVAGTSTATGEESVRAPMPGTVLTVEVDPGDRVEAGQRVAVLEAMKMELTLTSGRAGVVAEVFAAPGDQVPLGQVLVTVHDPEPAVERVETPGEPGNADSATHERRTAP